MLQDPVDLKDPMKENKSDHPEGFNHKWISLSTDVNVPRTHLRMRRRFDHFGHVSR